MDSKTKDYDIANERWEFLSPVDRALIIANLMARGIVILKNGEKVKDLDGACGTKKGEVAKKLAAAKKKVKGESSGKTASPVAKPEASGGKQSSSGRSVESDKFGETDSYRPGSPCDFLPEEQLEEVEEISIAEDIADAKEPPRGLLEKFLDEYRKSFWCPKPARSVNYQMHNVGGALPQVGLKTEKLHCEHDWESCDCSGEPLLVLSVHAMSEEKLAGLIVKRGDVYALARYFGGTGTLSGRSEDLEWYVSAPNQVVATFIDKQIREPQTLYSHSWLFNGGTAHTKYGRLQSTCLKQSAEEGEAVFKIGLIPGSPPIEKTVRWDAVADDYEGVEVSLPKGVAEYAARGGVAEITIRKVNAYGGFYFLWGQEEVSVVLSRALVNVVANRLIGKPREALLLQAAVAESRAVFAKVKNLPEDIKARTIVVTAAFALAELVPFETAVLSTTLDKHAKDFEVHSRLVTELKPIYDLRSSLKWVSYVTMAMGLGFGTALLGTRLYSVYAQSSPLKLTARFEVKPLNVTSQVVQDGHLVFACSPAREPEHPLLGLKLGVFGALAALYSGVSTTAKTYLAYWWGERKRLLGVDGAVPLPSGIICPVIEDVGENKYGRSEDAVIEETCEERLRPMNPRLIVYGIVINGSIPYCFKSASRLVEYSMLTDRLCIDTPAVDEAELLVADAIFRSQPPILRMLRRGVLRDVAKWLQHFPTAAKRKLMEDAMASLVSHPITPKDLIAKIFVKIEKSGFLLDDGPELTVPRPIVSRTPRFMCTVGPFFYGLGELMKEELNYEAGMYYAASTAEDAGRAFDHAISVLRQNGHCPVFLETDFSRLDAHETEIHLRLEHDFFESLGMEGDELWTDSQYKVVAYTYGGYKVLVTCRCTGDPKTSVANTLNNLRVINYITSRAKLAEEKFLLAGGDDGVAVVAEHLVPDEPTSVALDLGYRVKLRLVTEIYEVEFYSRLFWPTADGSVLGAKIGRWLMKASTMLITKDGVADYRSAIIGHLQDNFHVPFVREYCQRVLAILPISNSRYVEFEPHKVHTERAHDYCPDTFVFLYQRYGLNRSDLTNWIELLDSVESLPAVINCSWLQAVFDKDL